MKKTNMVDGACFGYYSKESTECSICKISKSCENATSSEKVKEVRAAKKNTKAIVDKFVKEYSYENH